MKAGKDNIRELLLSEFKYKRTEKVNAILKKMELLKWFK
jgi:hypothetical protein